MARIRAVLRRSEKAGHRIERRENQKEWRFDRWVLRAAERALIDETGTMVPLSSGEFKLLRVFLNRPGQVLGRDVLLDLTQGRSAKVFDRAIDNQVGRLRRKIERQSETPRLIQTVWGDGYKLVAHVTVPEKEPMQ